MEHIQLLTMESYIEVKKELIENANHTFDELDIEQVEEIKGIIEEIKEVYFEEEEEHGLQNFTPIKVWKADGYIKVNATLNVGRYVFLKRLKNRYSKLIEEKRDMEIVREIKKVLSDEFINSSILIEGQMKRIYEIIKYTLSKEERCDEFSNGKYMKEMNEEEYIFPFKLTESGLPIYCQNMQRVLFDVHRYIFVKPNERLQSVDITRFSFSNVKKIVDAVAEALKTNGASMGDKVDSKDDDSYIEGAEDYILLDEILGISLTNLIYWKTKEIEVREIQDNIITIVPYLAKCHYLDGRNLVARVLLDYLGVMDYNRNIIREIEEMLKKEINVWNEYYEEVEAVTLCAVFNYLKDLSENDLKEVCKGIEETSAWDEYSYMDEIAKDYKKKEDVNVENNDKKEDIWDVYIDGDENIEEENVEEENAEEENVEEENVGEENVESDEKKKENKIRIPKGDMDNRTWYAYIHKTVFDAIWS